MYVHSTTDVPAHSSVSHPSGRILEQREFHSLQRNTHILLAFPLQVPPLPPLIVQSPLYLSISLVGPEGDFLLADLK